MTDNYFILRDLRVIGTLSALYFTRMCVVDQNTSLVLAFRKINDDFTSQGKIKTLFVVCHGYENLGFLSGKRSDSWFSGGFGLQLGKENLLHGNVNVWSAIKDMAETIVVYSCGAADTAPGAKPGGPGDGKALMLALARNTNALVFAADRTQVYCPAGINFGHWEGHVFCFMPSGGYFAQRPRKELWEV